MGLQVTVRGVGLGRLGSGLASKSARPSCCPTPRPSPQTIPHWNKTLLTSDGGLTSDGHEVLHAVIRAALDCGAPAVAPAGLAVDGPDWTKMAAGEA